MFTKQFSLVKVPRLEASPRTSLKFFLLPESDPLPHLNFIIKFREWIIWRFSTVLGLCP